MCIRDSSETAVLFNITSKEQVIVNTWYGGEMKKGMFSMMNYFLPLKGIASMHCSANTDKEGKNTAIFFGLSGTGKTTLSTDPKRLLIGDDEHGWDDNGVFNFEGGCYAKVINLDKDSEPDIYNAIKRNALLENVTLDAEGHIDFADKSVTEKMCIRDSPHSYRDLPMRIGEIAHDFRYESSGTLKGIAVSYTHLDVYKRQVLNNVGFAYLTVACIDSAAFAANLPLFFGVYICLLYTSRCV